MRALAANRVGVTHCLEHIATLSFAGILRLHHEPPMIHGMLAFMHVSTTAGAWKGIWVLSGEGKNLIEGVFVIAAFAYFTSQNVPVSGRDVML